MLSECGYPPRVSDCCVRSKWCCDAVPSRRPLDGLSFLGSCSGSHEGPGITTGVVLSNTGDGAGPSANSEVPFVNSGIGLVMNNSDYTHTTFNERGPAEVRKECALEEAVTGPMGHTAKENGERHTVKASCKTTTLKRTHQDRPEAPRRKRIHVCGSKFGAVDRRMSTDRDAKDSTLGREFVPIVSSSRQGLDAGGGQEGIDNGSAKFQPKRAVEVEGVMDEDVEMTEVTDESDEHEPVDTCLPREEGISIGASRDDGTFKASEVEDGGSLLPVNPAEMQMPDSALESAWQERNPGKWWEGLDNDLLPNRDFDSSEDSARVLPSGLSEGIGEFSFRVMGTVEQIYDLLGSGCRRGIEIHNGGEGSLERRDDTRLDEEEHVELSSGDEPRSRNGHRPEDVEVIEVDDSDDDPIEMSAYDSDGSSTKGTKPVTRSSIPLNGFRVSTSQSTSGSFSPDEESDSDDCQVVGEWKPNLNPRRQPRNNADTEGHDSHDSDSDDDRSEESDSSDVEVAGGPQSEIQRIWEEAAMRRRMGRAMKSAGSKVNGEREATADLDLGEGAKSENLAESVATSAYRDSPDSTAESSEARGGAERFGNPSDGPGVANLTTGTKGRVSETLNRDEQVPSPGTEAKEVGKIPPHVLNADENQTGMPLTEPNGHESHREELLSSCDVLTPSASESKQKVVGTGDGVDKGDLIAAKERLKQTAEFMQADEQEWASRQQELLRQQVEAQKLRQRKRVEADRKLEMERKQKLRVLELRQNQIKAERDMDEKEQLRGQVRDRLEYLASKCTDLAGLLRRLGVNIEGGYNPSEQQVNAAFKRALVKFHPDRVVDGDVRRMVEAEETFKLINRMKKTLDVYDPFR